MALPSYSRVGTYDGQTLYKDITGRYFIIVDGSYTKSDGTVVNGAVRKTVNPQDAEDISSGGGIPAGSGFVDKVIGVAILYGIFQVLKKVF